MIAPQSIDSVLLLSQPGGKQWDCIIGAMKPGAHLLLFSNVKEHHLGTIAAEDAGLEIRDTIAWVFSDENGDTAMQLIAMARKPLQGTVAENVLRWGTGGLNIDGCRIGGKPWKAHKATGLGSVKFFTEGNTPLIDKVPHDLGRWPANLTHDNSPNIVAMFPNAKAGCGNGNASPGVPGGVTPLRRGTLTPRKDSGSAARFFYAAPFIDNLVAYLLRLITPPNGNVLTGPGIKNLPKEYNYVTTPEH